MKVVIGSKNPVKITAVQEAFKKVWPDESFVFEGVEVQSGVSDQPMSDLESIAGATNRAERAMETAGADYGVGLEGGIQKIGDKWFDCGWIVILSKEGKKGIGSSLRMETPPQMMELINQGMELGYVVDRLFNATNTKQGAGHFGLMTNNAIDRKSGYRDAIIAALAAFINPQIFE